MRLPSLFGVLISTRVYAFQFPGNHPASLISTRLPTLHSRIRAAASRQAASSDGDDGDLPVEVRALNEAEGKTMLEWPSVTKTKVDAAIFRFHGSSQDDSSFARIS